MGWVFSDQRKENTTQGFIRVDSRVNNSEKKSGKQKVVGTFIDGHIINYRLNYNNETNNQVVYS
jgi:hypothetical protein